VKFAWIKENQACYPVNVMCQILQVSRSGYYAWIDRPISQRKLRSEELTQRIRQAHQKSRGIYGSPRVHAELVEQKVEVCVNTVAKLMKEARIFSKIKRKFVVGITDSRHQFAMADNVLDRQFESDVPDKKWCCDITYIPTDQGWLYLAAVMDLCSRKIVGWSMDVSLEAKLCVDALQMALSRRQPGADLLHHSDRGVQYACDPYQRLLATHGISVSMSRKGNCHDNAAMESFFGSFKTESVYQDHYQTIQQAKQATFEYIEVFYNRQRRHSAIGYMSPEQFEASLN
jgi:transposase InsO family protein